MRLLSIPMERGKMTLQWKLVLDLGIFPLNHHWWKSLLVKLDIKVTLTNQLGKKNHKICAKFLEIEKHLPLELLSPRSPKTPKTDRSFLGVHTGILRICSKVSKRSKPPTFVLEWIPGGFVVTFFIGKIWGELLGKTWSFTDKNAPKFMKCWAIWLFEDLFTFCTSYDFRRGFLVTLGVIHSKGMMSNDVHRLGRARCYFEDVLKI